MTKKFQGDKPVWSAISMASEETVYCGKCQRIAAHPNDWYYLLNVGWQDDSDLKETPYCAECIALEEEKSHEQVQRHLAEMKAAYNLFYLTKEIEEGGD